MIHPWITGASYISPEGKQKLYNIATIMTEGAFKHLKETQFWDFADSYLKSGAHGLRYALQDTFIAAALGLDTR